MLFSLPSIMYFTLNRFGIHFIRIHQSTVTKLNSFRLSNYTVPLQTSPDHSNEPNQTASKIIRSISSLSGKELEQSRLPTCRRYRFPCPAEVCHSGKACVACEPTRTLGYSTIGSSTAWVRRIEVVNRATPRP